MQKNYWYSISLSKIFEETQSRETGLSADEISAKLQKHGRNILPAEKPISKIKLFFSQFNSPLMYILLVAVIVSFFLKYYTDAIFIIIVLLINTTVGFYQENKANKSLAVLKKMVKILAKVLRGGFEKVVDSEELVPGDIVFLKAGDKIPADARIIESKNFRVNEANLTGEWLPVQKNSKVTVVKEAPLAERNNMVFMGTVVEEGTAKAIVVATGTQTQIGELVLLLKRTKEEKTPLQKKILSLSRWTGGFILSIIFIVILEGYFTEKNFSDVFVAALALAVSAIPEGLLPAITVIMVLGMRRIFNKNGLVRKLAATETLGSVTVICTDKTGTLTEGNMQVSHILTSTTELLQDKIKNFVNKENEKSAESHILALKIATLTNEAFIENPEEDLQKWQFRGNPTERALLMASVHAGLNKKQLEIQYPRIDNISFVSDYKFAASYHKKTPRQNVLYVLGAPEEIIAKCVSLDIDGKKQKLTAQKIEKLYEKMEFFTQKGLRLVATAYKNYGSKTEYEKLSELVENLSFVGFIVLKDPLRKDAKDSILTAKNAGIRTVIITGDHKFTAQAVAEEIGIKAEEKNIIEGKDLEKMSDEELCEKAKDISIYARVSPRHKLRIVDALQFNGEIVAMIGDGVNDAPALKSADIGVVVGSGTDVAKEVADLVLLDDNFKTVIDAVEQGRLIFENIRKVFVYLVADDFSELFIFLAAMASGLPLPLVAAQILWINLVEDGLPDIALTTEKESSELMQQKPRNPKEPILNKPLKLWMTSIFFITGIASFLLFILALKITGNLAKTQTIVFALMCFDSLVFALCVRSFRRPIFRKDIFSNKYLLGAVIISLFFMIIAIYVPFLQKILSTQAMGISEWIIILIISFVEISLIEFFKKKIFC